MGSVFASHYACLTMGFLEETRLENVVLPRYFSKEHCLLILEILLRYIDDGFIPWPCRLNRSHFQLALNSLHPGVKFTIEEGSTCMTNGENIQRLPFLDVLVILLQSGNVQTDIFIKQKTATNTSILKAIIQSTLKRTLFSLWRKKIVQFASSYETEEIRRNLKQPKQHVFICNKNHKLSLFKYTYCSKFQMKAY